MRSGGQILVDQLRLQGVDAAFLVPGESFLPVLDALFDASTIRTIVCRHESGAAMMAEASGRLTGRPGVAFVTRGPGATNAASGVYVAAQGQTPMVLFVGLPARRLSGLPAFQDIDLAGFYAQVAKHVAIVPSASRMADAVAGAFAIALSGRPGPVVVGLPEDVLSESAAAPDAPRMVPALAAPSEAAMRDIADRLASAEQPMVIVGGPRWSRDAQIAVQAFALRFDLPVTAAFRAQDYFDNRHPSYCGHIGLNLDTKLATAIRASDLLLVIGAPLDEIGTAGWTIIKSPAPSQHIIHVHPGGNDPSSSVCATTNIVATADGFAAQLRTIEPPAQKRWRTFRRDLRAAYETTQRPLATPGAVQFGEIVRVVCERLPDTAVITGGAGNYAQFVHRYFTYKGFGTSLAPQSGTMGYGLPAAIAAKLADPQRAVVAFAGDGCFLMTAQELATAVQYDLPIIVIVANNAMYGTIRMHQERSYPGRVSGTSLVNPDFAALAESFGAKGLSIEKTDDFAPAFEEALASAWPTVLALRIDPEALTPQTTLSQFRAMGSGAKGGRS